MIIIRKAIREDIEKLWDFEKENRLYDRKIMGRKFRKFFLWNFGGSEKKEWINNIKKILTNKNCLILVVENREKLIGYALGKIYNFQDPRKIGHMEEFFITEKKRGKGISSRLMKKMKEWFKSKGIKYVSLEVFAKNNNVIKIYEKFGFEPFSIHMKAKIK